MVQTIYNKRKLFLNDFIPIFDKFYKLISNSEENVHLEYESQLEHNDLLILLKENINKDRALQYTSVGIHKDDLAFYH